jgi:uridine kinase
MASPNLTQDTLLLHLKDLIQSHPNGLCIVIDGDAAAGKTTLGSFLAETFNANLVHMDSFYLPFDRRTDLPWGHMDFSRLLITVLYPFRQHVPIIYEDYDAHQDQIKSQTELPVLPILILEGSFSFHPQLRPYIDVSIGMTISSNKQKERILKRSSESVFTRFNQIWIPKEKAYQQETDLISKVDYLLDIR